MIDLHTHILPGMDDGSPDAACSVEMLRRQKAQGVEAVCGTSHYYRRQNSIEVFCQRRAAALDRLTAALPQREVLPRVLRRQRPPISRASGITPAWSGCASRAPTPCCWKCPSPTGAICRWRRCPPWCWTGGSGWCWSTPSGFAPARQPPENPADGAAAGGSAGECRGALAVADPAAGAGTAAGSPHPSAGQRLPQPHHPCAQLAGGKKVVQQKLGGAFLQLLDQNAMRLVEPERREHP